MPFAKENIIQVSILGKNKTGKAFNSAIKNLDKFSKKAKTFGKNISVAGGVAAGAFTIFAKQQAAAGDALQKMSIRTRVSVEDLSRFKFAAEQSGASLQGLQGGLRRLAVITKDADDGLLEAQRSFKDLGIEIHDTNGVLKPVGGLFTEIAEKVSRMEDKTKAAALAQKLLGRSGDALFPLLLEGADGIKRLSDESDRLGNTWSALEADQAAAVTDALNRIKVASAGAARELFVSVAPAVEKFANKVSQDVIPNVRNWIRDNRQLAKTLTLLGPAGAAMGPAIVGLGLFAAALDKVIKVGTGVVAFVGGLASALAAIATAATAAVVGFAAYKHLKGEGRDLDIKFDRPLDDQVAGSTEDFLRKSGIPNVGGVTQDLPLQGTDETSFSKVVNLVKTRREAERKAIVSLFSSSEFVRANLAEFGFAQNPGVRGKFGKRPEFKPGSTVQQPALQGVGGTNGLALGLSTAIERAREQNRFFDAEGGVVAANAIARFSQIGDAIGGTFANELEQGKLRLKSFGAAFKQIFADIVAQIVSAIAKLLIFKGVLSFLGFGGVAKGFSLKDALGFNRGGLVGGGIPGRDSVPALLTPGEAVLPKNLVDRIMNPGGSPDLSVLNRPVVQPTFFLGSETEWLEIARRFTRAQSMNATGVA